MLAKYIELNCPGTKIEVFDGNLMSVEEIISCLDGDLIGISDWFINHRNAIKIAKSFKETHRDATVVLGGPNASNLAPKILQKHSEVDFVVYGDGEHAIAALITGLPTEQTSNVWYRQTSGEIRFSGQVCINLDEQPIFDFSHLMKSDIEKYRSNGRKNLGLTPVPISSIRGCLKAEKKGPCIYCSMPERKLRMMNPEKAWRQIAFLYEHYGIDYFFETGDSFAVYDYPEQFLKAKPRNLNVRFRNYATPDSLNEHNIRIFTELGVEEVFIGVESINSDVLGQANKSYDTTAIENTISLLEKNNIRVFLPFLFGLPGETYNSVQESSRFAQYLVKRYHNIKRVLFSLALPLAGTVWFNRLSRNNDVVNQYNDMGKRSLLQDDDIEYERLLLLSLEHYSKVTFSEIYKVLTKQMKEVPLERLAGFGCLENNVMRLAQELRIYNR